MNRFKEDIANCANAAHSTNALIQRCILAGVKGSDCFCYLIDGKTLSAFGTRGGAGDLHSPPSRESARRARGGAWASSGNATAATVLLGPIPARADEHLASAPGAEKQSGIVHRSLGAGGLDWTIADVPVGAVRVGFPHTGRISHGGQVMESGTNEGTKIYDARRAPWTSPEYVDDRRALAGETRAAA